MVSGDCAQRDLALLAIWRHFPPQIVHDSQYSIHIESPQPVRSRTRSLICISQLPLALPEQIWQGSSLTWSKDQITSYKTWFYSTTYRYQPGTVIFLSNPSRNKRGISSLKKRRGGSKFLSNSSRNQRGIPSLKKGGRVLYSSLIPRGIEEKFVDLELREYRRDSKRGNPIEKLQQRSA